MQISAAVKLVLYCTRYEEALNTMNDTIWSRKNIGVCDLCLVYGPFFGVEVDGVGFEEGFVAV